MILKIPNPKTAIITSYNRPVLYNNIVLLNGRRLLEDEYSPKKHGQLIMKKIFS